MWDYKWPVATRGVAFQICTMAIKTHHFNRLLAHVQRNYTWFVPKVSVLIFYLIIYWTYLKLQVISFEV